MSETGDCKTERIVCHRYCYGIEWEMERGGQSQGLDLCGWLQGGLGGLGHPTVKGRGQAVMSLNSMSQDFKVGPFRNCEALELAT